MKTNCIILEDEPLARKGLEEYVAGIEFLVLKGSFGNPVAALESGLITANDVLFADIGMPGISGIELVKMLDPRPAIVFTTAYPQHAVEGFEVNAVDYLVKPISFDRFLQAAMRARSFLAGREKGQAPAPPDHFFIKSDASIIRIFFKDILFAEALQNYVVIHTTQKKYISYLTFKSVEEYLDPAQFIKTHKSYIVAAARIDRIEGNDIWIGNHQVPVSRTLKEEVMEKLLKGRYLKR